LFIITVQALLIVLFYCLTVANLAKKVMRVHVLQFVYTLKKKIVISA